jgi:hypothetical protein
MKFIKFFLLIFVNLSVSAEHLNFKFDNKLVASISLADFQSGEIRLNQTSVKMSEQNIYNVFRACQRTYVGYDFFKLLELVYGNDWQKNHSITFVAKDGYTQFTPLGAMIAAAKKNKD